MNAGLLKRLSEVERLLGLGTGNGPAQEPVVDANLMSHWAAVEEWSRICRGQIGPQHGRLDSTMSEAEEELIVAEWWKLKAEQNG